MSDHSKIEWTDATWNPIRGCSRVSEGCRNCYAERTAARFSGPGQPYKGLAQIVPAAQFHKFRDETPEYAGAHWSGEVRFIPELLEQPLHWRRPRKIFVNSMSDLFHEKVTTDWLDQIFAVMVVCPQHTFQILTKRPGKMYDYLCHVEGARIEKHMARLRPGYGRLDWPWRNVWLGVSVEDQKTADVRIPLLLQTPAAVRWVSYEPALGPVDFSAWPQRVWLRVVGDDGAADRGRIDWVVAGGESGPGARPCHPDWIRQARDQCQAAGVPFFFKQWGEWLFLSQLDSVLSEREKEVMLFRGGRRPGSNQIECLRVGKKRAGALLDGIPWREFPAARA